MSVYQKLLPENVPAWQKPYWDGLREHQLLVQKCSQCGTLRHIPKEICPKCHTTAYEWTPISGEGEVFTYTIVHRAPTAAYQADAPYVIVHVQMADGIRMIADLHGEAVVDSVSIGMPVTADYDDVTPEWTLLRFVAR